MSDSLFESTVLDDGDTNVIVVTNSSDTDFAFSYFEEFLNEDQLEAMSDEDDQATVLSLLFDYCEPLVDPDILEEFPPTITQCIYVGSTTVIVLSLYEEFIEHIEEEYENSDDIREALFGDEENESEDEEDDEGDDEEWVV